MLPSRDSAASHPRKPRSLFATGCFPTAGSDSGDSPDWLEFDLADARQLLLPRSVVRRRGRIKSGRLMAALYRGARYATCYFAIGEVGDATHTHGALADSIWLDVAPSGKHFYTIFEDGVRAALSFDDRSKLADFPIDESDAVLRKVGESGSGGPLRSLLRLYHPGAGGSGKRHRDEMRHFATPCIGCTKEQVSPQSPVTPRQPARLPHEWHRRRRTRFWYSAFTCGRRSRCLSRCRPFQQRIEHWAQGPSPRGQAYSPWGEPLAQRSTVAPSTCTFSHVRRM